MQSDRDKSGQTYLSGLLLFAIVAVVAAEDKPAPKFAAAEIEFFEKKIRPVLVKHCYECHSEGAITKKKLRGGLRLDSRASVLNGGDTGPAAVPGKPSDSLIVQALKFESFEMPPQGKLPANVIADFERWVSLGLPDPRANHPKKSTTVQIDIEAGRSHWSYRPLRKPPVPEQAGAESAVDAFVLRALARNKLKQLPEASKEVLIRRIYFDLIGLPPTPEEVKEFMTDDRPDAYEQLVERLIGSPHFGERWGRHWLDVVRYAESITLRGFVFPHAWRYRDYVVDAFNTDRSVSRFFRDQIAGDLQPTESLAETQRRAIATTFLTMGNNNLEDQDKSKLRMDVVDEQLETIGRGLLAQTIGCARCHDHKFDPIPTKDYYALAGIFRNAKTLEHANVSKWIELPIPLPKEMMDRISESKAAIAKREKRVKDLQATLNKGKKSLGPLAVKDLVGIVVDDEEAELTGSWTASTSVSSYVGKSYRHDAEMLKGQKWASFKPKLPNDGDYEVRFAYTSSGNRSPDAAVTVKFAGGEKTFKIDQRKVAPINGRFVSLGVFAFQKAVTPEVVVTNANTTGVVIIDAVQFIPVKQAKRFAKTSLAKPNASAPQDKGQEAKLAAELKQIKAELAELKKQAPKTPMYMSVREEKQIEDARIHIRGNVHSLGEVAPRGVLQVANYSKRSLSFSSEQSGRAELADWIVDPSNPLTARVFVNRLWHWTFGAGIVTSVDNFGTTGTEPSHPDLLDYLAARLIEENWSAKQVLREIVLSRTYRSSSAPNAKAIAVDPENRLLWRMNRRRLDAECLQDAMLHTSGELDKRLGGSTVRNGTKNDYDYLHDSRRRAVYWPAFRNSLPELFQVFDFANPSMVTGKRDVSNSAPQALFLMNNPWVIDRSDALARRLLSKTELNDQSRLEYAFLTILSRKPSPTELRQTLSFVAATDSNRRQQKWQQVVQTLFASLDFRYLR